ncbi:hypothetical protein H0178_40700 [Cytobacillus firmus]|uniref:hypothetical protein n=1 Tax=Paenibacillus lautus TaxID=1401 RepID=UPI003850B67E|nr:hypothetical protein [Cytobacillus firmus]
MKKMKQAVFFLLIGIISSTHLLAEASDGTNLIKLTDSEVSSIQVIRLKGTDDSRIFRMTDGYDERIIRRVINWINTSSSSEQATELEADKVPLLRPTAGADGNLFRITLPGNIKTGISGIGIFYPDKKPTQRIGVQPDIHLDPTIEGIMEGRDEYVEKAVEIIKNGY